MDLLAPRRWARPLTAAVAVFAVYYFFAHVTRNWFVVPGAVGSVWWLGAGIALAIVIRSPRSWWPLLLLACGSAMVLSDLGSERMVRLVSYAVANMVEVGFAAWLLRNRADRMTRMFTPQDGARMVLALAGAVFVGAVIVGVVQVVKFGVHGWWMLPSSYLRAHALGLLAMVPLLLPMKRLIRSDRSVLEQVVVLATWQRAQLADKVADNERTIRLILRNALVGVAAVRLDDGHVGEIMDVNPAFAHLVEASEVDLVGRQLSSLVPAAREGDEPTLLDRFADVADGTVDTAHAEVALLTRTGERRWVDVSMTRVRPRISTPVVYLHVHDLTRRQEAQRQLETLAWRDALTGLPNRTYFLDRFAQELRDSRDDGTVVGLLYLDLERFKQINDEHGHDAGDIVLTQTARRLEGAVRDGDVVARLGGDEFVILCARTADSGSLAATVKRVRHAVAQPIELASGEIVTVGTSIGVAVSDGLPLPAEQATAALAPGGLPEQQRIEQMMRTADQAMYLDKSQRRTGAQKRVPQGT